MWQNLLGLSDIELWLGLVLSSSIGILFGIFTCIITPRLKKIINNYKEPVVELSTRTTFEPINMEINKENLHEHIDELENYITIFKLKYIARSRSSRFSSRVHSVKVNIKMKIKILYRELHARHTVHSDCYAHIKVWMWKGLD